LPRLITTEEARGKPSFRKWRAKIEKRKWTEDVEERTFKYGGYEFVWGDNNQDAKEKRLLNRIVSVKNNNNKKGQKITTGDADAELGAPMKKRRRLEREEALPLVCGLQAFKKWEALNDIIEMEYKKRFYIKGVHGECTEEEESGGIKAIASRGGNGSGGSGQGSIYPRCGGRCRRRRGVGG
jgi:hypothetical protein